MGGQIAYSALALEQPGIDQVRSVVAICPGWRPGRSQRLAARREKGCLPPITSAFVSFRPCLVNLAIIRMCYGDPQPPIAESS